MSIFHESTMTKTSLALDSERGRDRQSIAVVMEND